MWCLQRLYCVRSVGVGSFSFHSICSIYKAFQASPFCGVWSVHNVYGALRWEPSGIYSASSVYGASVLNVFCVQFTVSVVFMECFGLDVCGIHSVCCISEAFRLVFLVYLFSYSFCGVACSVYASLVWDPYGIHSVF